MADLSRRDLLKLTGLGAATLAGATGSPAAPARPHVLFILTDDMGYGDLSCYGGDFGPTPHLDQLAQEGTRFGQYYCPSPICSPSRTGATTGMYPGRWRITSYLQTRAGNRACEQADFLDPRAPSLARTLRAAGYATAHIGKWHLGGGRDVTDAPRFAAYGFDEHVGTWESPQPHPDITGAGWIWSDKDKVKRWDRTAFFVDRTLDFLRRHRNRPCYVNLWPDDTHDPYVPSPERLAQQAGAPAPERKFRAVLAELDHQMGRLFTGLRELGLHESTLVVFTSDNGAHPNYRGKRNGGLRGRKTCLYEGGIRMPCLVRWPGHVPAGKVDETSVWSGLDLFPTVCALAGVACPPEPALDGEDRSGVLLGTPSARRRPLSFEYGRNEAAFAYPTGRERSPQLAVRDGQWKLLVNADGSGAELYDVVADPRETRDLAADQPALAARLKDLVLAWRRSLP